jgi:site-specific DNA recombinase
VRGSTDKEEIVKKAVIYLRVSTAAQADKDIDPEGYSIPAQRRACYRKAEELASEVVEEFVDRGESARSADRPQLQAMLLRLRKAKDIDYVIVHKLDRLARSREDDVMITIVIRKAGAQLVSTAENIDDTPTGKMVHGMMATVAEWFSANNGVEALKGMTEKARKGGTPGKAPIGYLNVRQLVDGREIRTVAIDELRAPIVLWAFQAYATGEWTLQDLTDELGRRGLRSLPIGKKPAMALTKSRVSHMLNSRYYVGIVTFSGVEYPGRHEPLIMPELFLQVQDVLSGRRYAGEKRRTHHHYLKGTIFCKECRSRLTLTLARGRHGGLYLYFFCLGRQRGNGCLKKFAPVDVVDKKVEQLYAAVQLEPQQMEKLRKGLAKELADTRQLRGRQASRQKSRLAKLESERATLMQALYARAIPMDLFQAEQARISRERTEAESVLHGTQDGFDATERAILQGLDLAENLDAAYLKGSERVRRLINQAWWEKIVVEDEGPGGGKLTEHASALVGNAMAGPRSRAAEAADVVFSGGGLSMSGLVRQEGLEPPTYRSEVCRSVQIELLALPSESTD